MAHRLVDGSLLRNDQPAHAPACRPQPRLPTDPLLGVYVGGARAVDFGDKALPSESADPPRRAAIMNKIHRARLVLIINNTYAREFFSRNAGRRSQSGGIRRAPWRHPPTAGSGGQSSPSLLNCADDKARVSGQSAQSYRLGLNTVDRGWRFAPCRPAHEAWEGSWR